MAKQSINLIIVVSFIILIQAVSAGPVFASVCGNGICELGEDTKVIVGQTNSVPPSYIYGLKCEADCPCASAGQYHGILRRR